MTAAIDLTIADIENILLEQGLIDEGTRVISAAPSAPSASGLMGTVTRLRVVYDPPAATGPRTLILKTASDTSPLSRDMSQLEARFYAERIADAASINVPAAYYCRVEEPLLLLEDLGESGFIPQIAGCSKTEALGAIREIAKLHARWWNGALPDTLRWIQSPLDSPAGHFCAHWLQSYNGSWPPVLGPIPEILQERYAEIGERVGTAPSTIVHGDFHSGNISFGLDGRVTLVDFHRVEHATGMADIARFLATSLQIETRRAVETDLLREYLRCLQSNGVQEYDMDRCIADLRSALLWALASPLALHIRGIMQEGRDWPSHFPILERCLTAIDDWDALQE